MMPLLHDGAAAVNTGQFTPVSSWDIASTGCSSSSSIMPAPANATAPAADGCSTPTATTTHSNAITSVADGLPSSTANGTCSILPTEALSSQLANCLDSGNGHVHGSYQAAATNGAASACPTKNPSHVHLHGSSSSSSTSGCSSSRRSEVRVALLLGQAPADTGTFAPLMAALQELQVIAVQLHIYWTLCDPDSAL